MLLPMSLTAQEIRVLQEYRRLKAEALALEDLATILHPSGGGEAPALSLVEKGFLVRGGDGRLHLTESGTQFLAREAVP